MSLVHGYNSHIPFVMGEQSPGSLGKSLSLPIAPCRPIDYNNGIHQATMMFIETSDA